MLNLLEGLRQLFGHWQVLSRRLLKSLQGIACVAAPHVPCSAMNTACRFMKTTGLESIVDIGGGQGASMNLVNKKHSFSLRVNAEIDSCSMMISRARGAHDQFVLADAGHLPFRRKSFDIVFCWQVLEHMNKETGRELLPVLEGIARKQVIIATPVSPPGEHTHWHPREFEAAESSWHPVEFKQLGYKVRGYGNPLTKGHSPIWDWSFYRLFPFLLVFFLNAISGPLFYYFPSKAGGMVCVKQVAGAGLKIA